MSGAPRPHPAPVRPELHWRPAAREGEPSTPSDQSSATGTQIAPWRNERYRDEKETPTQPVNGGIRSEQIDPHARPRAEHSVRARLADANFQVTHAADVDERLVR